MMVQLEEKSLLKHVTAFSAIYINIRRRLQYNDSEHNKI